MNESIQWYNENLFQDNILGTADQNSNHRKQRLQNIWVETQKLYGYFRKVENTFNGSAEHSTICIVV